MITHFHIADSDYAKGFDSELNKDGNISKGPYLDISDSFKTGKNIDALIREGEVSPLFAELEPDKAEKDKEVKLKRPLYLHQEEAIRKVNQKHNLVVTTGTGSGKTECFILPIINHLLREKEQGTLDNGVRAILIYPMNALANDQMKRLRDILAKYPIITFGVYNSSTAYTDDDGIRKYGEIFTDENGNHLKPLPNEIISRSTMQKEPPHILVTNYAMLEYMMLRPKDDKVFSGAQLRFLVLDEAHIYRGTTGMETSLLLRRLKARISDPKKVQHILTSATLGGKESDGDIVCFAETLCAAKFQSDDIIRSQTQMPKFATKLHNFPLELFADLAEASQSLNSILQKYSIRYDDSADEAEIIFDLCRESSLYKTLRQCAKMPLTIKELTQLVNAKISYAEIESKDIVNLITVATKAEKEKTSLLKARYHMFIRALEGAYITIGPRKDIFLKRIKRTPDNNQCVFEAAVCDDCGRMGIVGKINPDNVLVFANNREDKKDIEYFLLREQNETWTEYVTDDEEPAGLIGENDYVICAKCGHIIHVSQQNSKKCNCGNEYSVNVRKATRTSESQEHRCPSCNSGHLRTFYLGYDAATSVLATELFEQLPERESVLKRKESQPIDNDNPFAVAALEEATIVQPTKMRQFLSFSDSRSDAAFFACSLKNSYEEFLRRRGIWHIIEQNKDSLSQQSWEIATLIDELTKFFDTERTFSPPGYNGEFKLTPYSKYEAWKAVLNEMVGGRRPTSLTSLGVLDFVYTGCTPTMMQSVAKKYKKSVNDITALFNLLVMDIIYNGAVEGQIVIKDKREKVYLKDTDREYIYYTAVERRFIRQKGSEGKKKSYLNGWLPTLTKNGKNYPNARIARVMRALEINEQEATKLLADFWDYVLTKSKHSLITTGNGEYYLPTDMLQVRVGMGILPVYRCEKCGRVTMKNCQDNCISVRCNGKLREIPFENLLANNHFARLYSSNQMKPLHIKEHTAQLGRKAQQDYQEMFIKQKINALSCSTTFEMGVDVGTLETVYLRDMPPTPANYVQRAGRAGRSLHSAAYALTYAKLSSHDFTYFEHPERMIAGKIGVPVFEISNEKVVRRHIFAIALSDFFSSHPDVYANNDADKLLNSDGYEELVSYLESHPSGLKKLLKASIPKDMQSIPSLSIDDWGWIDLLIGKEGVLSIAVADFRSTVKWYEQEVNRLKKSDELQSAARYERRLKEYRRNKTDGLRPNQLIEFLVRNNVLPKYGFPVDTVELYQSTGKYADKDRKELRLERDLQQAIGEYAPGSQVVADGLLYTSRYIRKLPNSRGHDWEEVYIAQCADDKCATWNYRQTELGVNGEKCISCQKMIPKRLWRRAIEPRKGFVADSRTDDVPIKKPERLFRSEDYYIGDTHRKNTNKHKYKLKNGLRVQLETSPNDSLMVICQDKFFVCDKCGYAISAKIAEKSEKDFSPHASYLEKNHDSAWGKECNGKLYQKRLCHVFKTDVMKITFGTDKASDYNTMLSVMYALLEAMSDVLDIERNDIKGCLHKIRYDNSLIHSVILYDAVAGGAGHVRRLATNDGKVFQQIVERAINITKKCHCDPSCYSCLRNYYNQAVHDLLDRHAATNFLSKFHDTMMLDTEDDT